MSDFYRNDPNQPYGDVSGQPADTGDASAWRQDGSFAPPSSNYQGQEDAFAAWRKPAQEDGTDASLLSGAPHYGAEMQQGGVPLYSQMQADAQSPMDFRAQGADAPTRIARPAIQGQMVNKYKTLRPDAPSLAPLSTPNAGESQGASPISSHLDVRQEAAASAAPGRRRRSQRYVPDEGGAPQDAGDRPPLRESPAAYADSAPHFDPFEAGDSESDAPAAAPMRRPAAPDGHYQGARTAMPASGAPIPRARVGALREGQADSPIRPERPQGMPAGQRPPRPAGAPMAQRPQGAPMGQRPQGVPTGQRPQRPAGAPLAQRPQGAAGAAPVQPRPMRPQQPGAPRGEEPRFAQKRGFEQGDADLPQAKPLQRPRYDFEDEEEYEQQERRKGGLLIPLLIVLLVIGGLLAGICLPKWESMDNGVAKAVGAIKGQIVGLFDGIFPAEDPIKAFTCTPAETQAPTELRFDIRTATSVKSIRILDKMGQAVLEKTITDEASLSQDVVLNSNETIWTLRYQLEDEYIGLFTVQSMKKDGTWDDGMSLTTPVAIAAPAVVEPPVQGFTVSQTTGTVPMDLTLMVITSKDVVGVSIDNDYGDSLVSMDASDVSGAVGTVTDSQAGRIWNLLYTPETAYSGKYTVSYQTEQDPTFMPSEYSQAINLTMPAATPSPLPASAPADEGTEGESAGTADLQESEEPKSTPAATTTVTPSPTPAPTPSPTPVPTPLPKQTASSTDTTSPSAIKLSAKIYNELKTVSSYSRTRTISIPDPYNYAIWEGGVFTFRGGSFRQNASFGTVEVEKKKLEQVWNVPVGSFKTKSKTLYGVGWPGQPAIVKWYIEARGMMNLTDEKKETSALKEVMLAAQDGKIYFLDLSDGTATRDPIDVGVPIGSSVSVATDGTPMLAVGQSHSILANKTLDMGLRVYNLINGKQLLFIDGREKPKQNADAAISGSPIFDKQSGSMIFGSKNGLLYTVDFGSTDEVNVFDHVSGTIKIKETIQRYASTSGKQKKTDTGIDNSVAMYGSYAYYADEYGVLQCVDVNTMQAVWAVSVDDATSATIALDYEDDGSVALYTGNMIDRTGKKGVCTIRRLNALTGETVWSYAVEGLTYDTKYEIGCKASPVVGKNSIDDLVIFTVSNGESGAMTLALDKKTGKVKWQKNWTSYAYSSPVAVYNEAGDAWLVQGENSGALNLMNASNGEVLDTMQLDGEIVGSPAVYRDMLVIGTGNTENSKIYGIQIQ